MFRTQNAEKEFATVELLGHENGVDIVVDDQVVACFDNVTGRLCLVALEEPYSEFLAIGADMFVAVERDGELVGEGQCSLEEAEGRVRYAQISARADLPF